MKNFKNITTILLCVLSIIFLQVAHANDSTQQVIDQVLTQFSIPQVTSEKNVQDQHKVGQRSFTFKTDLQKPAGDNYVVLTDITSPTKLAALGELAQVHHGSMIELNNLRQLVDDPAERAQLVDTLKKHNIAYLAIAPRYENYSENVVLALWEVLTELGGGKINVYPGFLVAPNDQSFVNLVNSNIQLFKSQNVKPLDPVVIAQSVSQAQGGLRAVQKADLIKVLLNKLNAPTNGLVVRDRSAPRQDFPQVGNLGTLDVAQDGLLHNLPQSIAQTIANARLLVLFGHGSPGMTASIDVQAFADLSLADHIILCGSCFSAVPVHSDFSNKNLQKEPFFQRAIESGATVFYGHMRLNGGFPQLFVLMQAMLNGESVGQGYQRLLNVMIATTHVPWQQYTLAGNQVYNPGAVNARNDLLYMMIGDPAVHL